ncbi:MAG: hypothetical protein H7A36_04430 [Chlamydiales bacterium]|nr:hypothetical protein [Chlamydiales bacterium]
MTTPSRQNAQSKAKGVAKALLPRLRRRILPRKSLASQRRKFDDTI